MPPSQPAHRVTYGDWQTPPDLARACLARLAPHHPSPAAVVEPTCGVGAFLVAARSQHPDAALHGWELNPAHLDAARGALPSASLHRADFFETPWEQVFSKLPDPLLVVGNPPWVTASALGALDARNRPAPGNPTALRGLDARTGRSNFDVSEWMILRLVDALADRDATLAMLCKSAVARRVVETLARRGAPPTMLGLWPVDARAHFAASVDACLFALRTKPGDPRGATPVYASLDATTATRALGLADDALVPDLDAWRDTAPMRGVCDPEWRSGLKHDCAAVMELTLDGDGYRDAQGEAVTLERDVCFPLLKGTDVARGRLTPTRAVIVPQRRLGDDTARLATEAPAVWAWLTRHAEALRARRSSIYRGRCDFAVFGVGDYAFAPWKVAISGLHKSLDFALVGPHEGRPVMFDDTCYFAPFAHEDEARDAHTKLTSAAARRFFEARVFWDAKRPIHKSLLQSLDLARVPR